MTTQAWTTDEELMAAAIRFVEGLPDYELPVAYGVGRLEHEGIVFGHINRPGGEHLLPAVVLASVCNHANGTATYELTAAEMAEAVARLQPAEAATHVDHPNLWSWRKLLAAGSADSCYVAIFVQRIDDAVVDEHDARFRAHLHVE